MNKRVLMICYYFPPLGGAGVGRPLSLYRYLPEHGCECDVLTVKPVTYRVYEPELLEGLSTERIYRSGSNDPQRLMYMFGFRRVKDSTIRRGRRASGRFFPDPKIGWVRSASKLGRILCENRSYDALITTSPPMSCHLVGQKLSAEFKVPWVADFRDFWTSHKIEDVFDSPARIERAWALVEKIKADATAVTVCNGAIAEYLKTGEVVYNSYDPVAAEGWKVPGNGDDFVIGLLGTFDDIVPVEPLFKVLARVRRKDPGLFKRIRIEHVGRIDSAWLETQLREYDLKARFVSHGYHSKRESSGILSSSSLVYLGLGSRKEEGIVPSRLFDLFASGRPILASVSENGESGRLILPTENGGCFNADSERDVDSAADYVITLLRLNQAGDLKIVCRPEYARKYTAENMAAQFARIIKAL